MNWKFEYYHFQPTLCLTPALAADFANAKLQEWLKEAKVVYGHHQQWRESNIWNEAKKKGLLINIEPTEQSCPGPHKDFICGCCFKEFHLVPKEQCKHEASKVRQMNYFKQPDIFQCQCGVKVTPSTFEEEK